MTGLLKSKVEAIAAAKFPFAKALDRVAQSPLRDVLDRTHRPGVISLALGMPAGEMFPTEDFAKATARVLECPLATQYGEPHRPLKEHIVRLMERRGVQCSEEEVFLTAGAQQGLSLISQLLLDPKATVITEDTIYDGLQMVLQACDARVLEVSTCLDTGMDVDAVEKLLHRGVAPRFIYTITDGHNPLGVSMTPANRQRLVELARRYRVPILEDDAYGFLYYDQDTEAPPPLRALDDQWVFYLGSFSKILAPALRLGWVVVPRELTSSLKELTTKLSVLKQAADFDTATLTQRSVASYLDGSDFSKHLEEICGEYRRRRDAMVAALQRHFPSEVRWNRPANGLFLWLEFPPDTVNVDRLFERALEREKVAFLPGGAFSLNPNASRSRHCVRLSFGNSDVETIEEGVARLGRVLKAELVGSAIGRPGPRALARGHRAV